MSEQGGIQRDGGNRPVPDPTVLTTAALVESINRLKELMETKIEALDHVSEQRYYAVAKQLEFLEQQRKEQKSDTAAAVAQALAAQKDAVSKSESSMTRQLEQLGSTLKAVEDGLRRDNEALKDRVGGVDTRVTTVEQQKVGAKEDRTGLYATLAAFGGVIMIAIGVIAFIAGK
jgi:phosphatidate phosphatase APP1